MQWGEGGTRSVWDPRPQPINTPGLRRYSRRFQWATRWEGPTQERSLPLPLALASLVLGSRRSETGLFEIGFGELARADRGHEALFTRRRGAERFASRGPIATTVSLLR